jgi:plasmid maintenance system antidote protein VapI
LPNVNISIDICQLASYNKLNLQKQGGETMNETLFRIHLVAKGLKISDIERDLDIPRASINKWLKNETGIQLNKAVQIANYTGMDMAQFNAIFCDQKLTDGNFAGDSFHYELILPRNGGELNGSSCN